jgi:hypothetical protein
MLESREVESEVVVSPRIGVLEDGGDLRADADVDLGLVERVVVRRDGDGLR